MPGFNFTAAKLSPGGDLGEQQVGKSAAQMARMCLADPACKGFSSSGWLKSSFKIPDLWTDWGGGKRAGPCDGLFVRRSASFESEPQSSSCALGQPERIEHADDASHHVELDLPRPGPWPC